MTIAYGRWIKRFLALLLCFFLLQGLFPLPVRGSDSGEEEPAYYVPDFELQAASALVLNLESGFAVYEKDADIPFPAASLVKLMTAIIVRARVQDIDAETVTAEVWVFNELFGKNVSHADIWKDETLTVRELLYALLLPSGNEAALMLASYASGGYIPNFVYMMNQKAAALGCTGTVFADVSGLAPESVTTARDIALIMQAFMQDEVLVEIASTPVYEMAAHNHPEPYLIHTTNRLLVNADSYTQAFPRLAGTVKAGKTGSLGEWQNFVCIAEKASVSYCVVALGSPNTADILAAEEGFGSYRPALYEAARLLNWTFSAFALEPALDIATPVCEIPVKYSTDASSVHLLPLAALTAPLPVGMNTSLIEKTYNLPEYLPAPVHKGDVVGSVTLSIQGQVLGSVELAVARDIGRNGVLYALHAIGAFFISTFFKVFIGLVLLLFVLYTALMLKYNADKRKRRAARRVRPAGEAGPVRPGQRRRQPPARTGTPPKKGR